MTGFRPSRPASTRRLPLVACLALLVASACTDTVTHPEAPTAPDAVESPTMQWHTLPAAPGPRPLPMTAAGSASALTELEVSEAELDDLAGALFPEPGLATAARAQIRNILRDLDRGNDADALLKAQDFRDFTLQRYEQGQLTDPNGAEPPSLEQALAAVLNSVFEAVGLPGGQVVEISRVAYGSPLIDAVDPGQFPRGGFYEATVAGEGIESARGIVIDDPNVFGFVTGSPGPGLLTVRVGSIAVERGRPDLAEILDVPFEITTDLGGGAPLVVGSGAFDIVPGPAPVASPLEIVGPVTALVRGQTTSIDVATDITTAGNLRFVFAGCACSIAFTGVTGDQFQLRMTVTATWDIPADSPFPTAGLALGAVSGAELEGRAGLTIPVVDP